MMNIIFLDIDGVLSTAQGFHEALKSKSTPPGTRKFTFDKNAVDNLNTLSQRSDAGIVIISSWRLRNAIEGIQKRFMEEGITGCLIGFTPSCVEVFNGIKRRNREEEILAWTKEQKEEFRFVILDDEDINYTDRLRSKLVKCDPVKGFGDADKLKEALEILKGTEPYVHFIYRS